MPQLANKGRRELPPLEFHCAHPSHRPQHNADLLRPRHLPAGSTPCIMSGKRPTDDLIPPAKKRGNERQITKDDAEEEDGEVSAGPTGRHAAATL